MTDQPITHKCPTCESPNPKFHPALSAEGEVTHICPDAFHGAHSPITDAELEWLQNLLEDVVESDEIASKVTSVFTEVRRLREENDDICIGAIAWIEHLQEDVRELEHENSNLQKAIEEHQENCPEYEEQAVDYDGLPIINQASRELLHTNFVLSNLLQKEEQRSIGAKQRIAELEAIATPLIEAKRKLDAIEAEARRLDSGITRTNPKHLEPATMLEPITDAELDWLMAWFIPESRAYRAAVEVRRLREENRKLLGYEENHIANLDSLRERVRELEQDVQHWKRMLDEERQRRLPHTERALNAERRVRVLEAENATLRQRIKVDGEAGRAHLGRES